MNDSTSATSQGVPARDEAANELPPEHDGTPMPPLAAVFDHLPDPRRQNRNKLHLLSDILTIATCAVIGGAETWDAIALFGRCKEAFLAIP